MAERMFNIALLHKFDMVSLSPYFARIHGEFGHIKEAKQYLTFPNPMNTIEGIIESTGGLFGHDLYMTFKFLGELSNKGKVEKFAALLLLPRIIKSTIKFPRSLISHKGKIYIYY
mgnify:CR=1 FL=1